MQGKCTAVITTQSLFRGPYGSIRNFRVSLAKYSARGVCNRRCGAFDAETNRVVSLRNTAYADAWACLIVVLVLNSTRRGQPSVLWSLT